MNEADIDAALKLELETNLSELPQSVAWPNQAHDGLTPFLEVIFAGGSRDAPDLKAERINSTGVMTVNVVVETASSDRQASEWGDKIAALFKAARRIAITGGTITIVKPPDVRKGFPGEKGWTVPVVINYRVSQT